MRWAGHVACVGKKLHRLQVFWGKLEGKGPFGREDNIKNK
jgi:hypothetical protein